MVAGQAGIAQSASTTTVTQSSQRAAVNWQSFDVGSQQTVQFQQPSSSAMTLNRVVGPNPSQIAGKIQANGQIVVTNQAGVVFDKGSQVNAAGLVVSAAGISTANFMAGQMIFDQPADPDARIVNRGTLTVGQHGLAALVAPQVRNAGVIRAPLGTVILAGAEADTLDLYGDGLVSINVTKQVTQAPGGGKALVTNTGTIHANGGSVVLTADAVDGVVQTLVDAGGKISANSTHGRTGRVLISGAGGDVRVEGTIDAQGVLDGTTGGDVRVSGRDATVVGPKAQIDVSGKAGGGVVALGTTLAHAKSRPGTAAATTQTLEIKQGATISADATRHGNGGRVVGLSSGITTVAGTITATGGSHSGNGGFVETAGVRVNMGRALVDTMAPTGDDGTWLIKADGFVVASLMQAARIATALTLGNVEIKATRAGQIFVNAAISAPTSANTLELKAHHGIQINAPVNLGTQGTLDLIAKNSISQSPFGVITTGELTGKSAHGAVHLNIATNDILDLDAFDTARTFHLRDAVPTLTVTGAVDGGTGVRLVNTRGGLAIDAGLISNRVVTVAVSGAITEDSEVGISTPLLKGSAGGDVTLDGINNVGTLGKFTVAGYAFTLNDPDAPLLTVDGPVDPTNVTLTAPAIDIPTANAIDATISISLTTTATAGGGTITEDGTGSITTPLLTGFATGDVTLDGANNVGTLGMFSATGYGFTLTDAGASLLTVNGALDAATVNLAAPTIDIPAAGAIDATTSVALTTTGTGGTGTITEDGTGSITTPLLTGSATSDVTLDGANNVGSIGGFSAAGYAFTLNDPNAPLLTVNGALDAATVTLTAPVIDIPTANAIDGTTSISLATTGGSGTITEDGTGSITTPLLTGFATGDVTLDGANNVGSIGGFTATGYAFTLNDPGAPQLTVNGALDAATVSLTAPSIDIPTAGAIDSTTSISLTTTGSGTITEDGTGSITTPLLTGSATGDVTLDGANNVGALGAFTATGYAFTLNDPAAPLLTVNGALDAATVSLTAPIIDIPTAGGIDGTVSISLTTTGTGGTGTITEDGTGSITTPLLTGSATGDVTLDGNNSIDSLGAFTASGLFTLTDGAALTVVGPVQSQTGNVYLIDTNSGGITFADGGSLELVNGGTIGLRTDTLVNLGTSSATGIANSGSGTFELAPDTSGLTVTLGAAGVSAATLSLSTLTGITAGTVRIGEVEGTTTAGSILIIGPFHLGNANLDLESLGVITESGAGTLTTPLLTGAAGGNVTLSGKNDVAELGRFTATGFGFTLSDAAAPRLTVSGPLNAATVSLTAPVMDIPAAGAIDGTISVALKTTGGDITEDGTGSIATPLLTGHAHGSATLDGANTVANLGPFTAATGFTLNDAAAPLTVAGAVDGGSAVTLANTGALAIDAPVSATGIVDLKAAGMSQTAAGVVIAGTLTGSAGNDAADFGTAANKVTNLGPFTATAGFTLNDATPALTVIGAIDGGPFVTLTNTGSLAIDAPIEQADTVTLVANGISQTAAGVIAAGLLTGSAGTGSANLGAATNLVTALGPFTATTGFTLNNSASPVAIIGAEDGGSSVSLAVIGPVNGGTGVSITNAAPLVIDAGVTATGTVALTAAGISQSAAGVITAGTLIGSAGNGAANFGTATNVVARLGPFTAGTGFTLKDSTPALTVVGPVNGGPFVTLANTGSLALDAGVAGTDSVTLSANGISQDSAGVLATNTLTGTAGTGSADLGAAVNLVTNLGAFTATTGFTLNDGASPLTVTGAVNGGQFVTLTDIGALALNAGVTGTNIVTLTANGITQNAAGVITTALLTGTAGTGAADFGTAANQVTDLGPFTAAGFTLNDSTPALTVVGQITGGSFVTLTNTGSLAIDAAIDPTNTVTLVANGITQAAAGVITAGTLTGSAGTGSADLGTAINLVTHLGPFTASTGFTLNDRAAPLTVIGAVNGGTGVSLTNTGALVIDAGLTGTGTVALTAAGISQSAAGVITAGMLTGSAGNRAADFGTAANEVTDLGPFTARTGFTLNDAAPALTVTGAVKGGSFVALVNAGSLALDASVTGTDTVTLTANGIAQNSAGVITTNTLTGTAGTGSAALGTATNLVTNLGAFTATTGFTLNDSASPLTVIGAVNGGTGVSLTNTGALMLDAGLTGTGTVSLTAAGISQSAAGVVTAGTLTGSAGSGAANFGTATNVVTGLGPFTAGNGFTLNDATPALTVTGAVNGGPFVTLTNTGSLAFDAGVTGADTVTLTANSISQNTAGIITTNRLTGTAGTGSADLGIADNAISTLDVFAADGAFHLLDDRALSVVGNVTAGTDAGITVEGNGNSLQIDQGITVQSGSTGTAELAVNAGSLVNDGSVRGGTLASLTAQAYIDQNGSVTAGTSAIIHALTGNITENGIVTAPNIQLFAPDGVVTFSGTFAGVVPDPTLDPHLKLAPGTFPSNTSIGAWISASTIVVAPSAVVTGAGGGRSQLVIALTSPNGTVTFADFDNQKTQLYLDLGTGFASGQIEVDALQVEYTQPGTTATINLIGTVNGQSGTNAAFSSFIRPIQKQNYQVNGCPIQSTSCIRITTLSLPTINPLKDLEVETPRPADDILVILPDVGERDY